MGEHYAAIIRTVQLALAASYVVERHAFGACSKCHTHHCLTHPPVTCKGASS